MLKLSLIIVLLALLSAVMANNYHTPNGANLGRLIRGRPVNMDQHIQRIEITDPNPTPTDQQPQSSTGPNSPESQSSLPQSESTGVSSSPTQYVPPPPRSPFAPGGGYADASLPGPRWAAERPDSA